jgi:uncharacterized protein YdcH (DUF465 family)
MSKCDAECGRQCVELNAETPNLWGELPSIIQHQLSEEKRTMPVKHDLYADLSITKDELIKLRGKDAKLNHLVDQYDAIDADIVKAEAGSAGDVSDDQLKKLKEKRLLAKDKIVQQVAASG